MGFKESNQAKQTNKIKHSKLLLKLHRYGIRGNALSWIRPFFGSRSETVVIEGRESGSVPGSSGVPQGSVLGSILFPVFLNDLPEKLWSQVRLFADDMAVYLTVWYLDDGAVLQIDLDTLSMWDLEFNPSKCLVVCVTTARKAIYSIYTLLGHILEVVVRAKYLGGGGDISSGLTWNSRIDRITENANRTLEYTIFAELQRLKTNRWDIQPTIHLFALSCGMRLLSETFTLKKNHSSLRRPKEDQTARWTTSNHNYRSSVTSMLDQLNWRSLEQRRTDARLLSLLQNGSWTCGSNPPRLRQAHIYSVPLLPLNGFLPGPNE